MSEEQVLVIINNILGFFAKKFRFGYYDEDDLKQEGFLIAYDGLERYDGRSPLENFLTVHIRNRLISLKRDKYRRKDIPCHKCPFFDPEKRKSMNKCAAFTDKQECVPFKEWNNRNNMKQGLMAPVHMYSSRDENKPPMEIGSQDHGEFQSLLTQEIKDKITSKLHVKYRADFFRLLDGVKLGEKKLNILHEEIKKILGDILEDVNNDEA